ncbi:MAG: permease [Acidobacteriota bacterium]
MTTLEATSERPRSGWDRVVAGWLSFFRAEGRWLAVGLAAFAALWYLPVGVPRFDNAVTEALALARWYAREHVLLCLVPAFFIAGAIGVFLSQAAVMRWLGPQAPKAVAYGVASVSGTLLAVCSCTVLPLFASIHRRGAGLGPAIAFLYSGPAINVLAIVLTARVLGFKLGIARAVAAILLSVVVGAAMHLLFLCDERQRQSGGIVLPDEDGEHSLAQTALFFALMVAVLVFANWGAPAEDTGLWAAIYHAKWWITSLASAGLAVMLVVRLRRPPLAVAAAAAPAVIAALAVPDRPHVPFTLGVAGLSLLLLGGEPDDEGRRWFESSWGFARQIMPLLFAGVLVAGFALGRPGHEGIIPSAWVEGAVGGNSLAANLFASVAGAFMYFATLTEVPILEGLLGAGMGQGPALALLLAGPALSLPNMLVIRSVLGTRKTVVYVGLVVIASTISGLVFGAITAA